MNELSRRNFLKGAGIGSLGILGAGALAACAPSTNTSADTSTEQQGSGESQASSSTASWRTPPAPIDESEITQEYTAEVIVVGHGYAGITAFREISESGHSAILIESQPEDGYSAQGNTAAAINMPLLLEKGVPEIDPVEFYNNWQINAGNTAHPELIMKFIKKSAENTTWYYDQCTQEQLDSITVHFFSDPADRSKLLVDGIFPFKFWAGSCGGLDQTEMQTLNREAAIKAGGEVHFSTKAQQLVQDESGKVIGLIATDADGNYVKFNGSVMLGTGGFGQNPEMLEDLLPDLANLMVEGEDFFCLKDTDGSGIQMAHWAGARLESGPIATMDGKIPWVGEKPAQSESVGHPQGLWLDKDGKRFCNEYWGPIEFRTRPASYMNRSKFFCFYDSNLPEYLKYYVPSHGTTDPSEENLTKLQAMLDGALAAGPDGPFEGELNAFTPFYGGETLEELIDNMGITDEELRTTMLESIARYNELCEKGVDEDFGRQSNILFPVKEGPFFAQIQNVNKAGGMLCTMGGLITDGDQRVLDSEYNPIPGLYASGNTTGRRFGSDYFTPIYGISLGICITLGREAGRAIVKDLEEGLI